MKYKIYMASYQSKQLKMFIEVRHLNKWNYIGQKYYSLPNNKNEPILCRATNIITENNPLVNYIISGNCEEFAKGIGGKQYIEKRDIPLDGNDKCSDCVLNVYNDDLKHDCMKDASYVFLSELKEIAKFEPFELHGYFNKTSHLNYIIDCMHILTRDNVFDIMPFVITCIDETDPFFRKNDEYEFVHFQSKCITHLINDIEYTLKSKFKTNIFDNTNNFTFSPEDVRLIFWYDE